MKWTWLFVLVWVVGCGSKHVQSEAPGYSQVQAKQEKTLAEFERANAFLDNDRPADAAAIYDRLIVDNPVDQLDVLIIFNSGVAHFEAKNCEVAGERFRKVIRISNKKSPTVQGRAMLKLGDVYACLADDNKAITNLVELFRGNFGLPIEIARAE